MKYIFRSSDYETVFDFPCLEEWLDAFDITHNGLMVSLDSGEVTYSEGHIWIGKIEFGDLIQLRLHEWEIDIKNTIQEILPIGLTHSREGVRDFYRSLAEKYAYNKN
jgi:hypothetical protein